MDKEKQRAAVGEACGWKRIEWKGRNERETFKGWHSPDKKLLLLPDFLNDLNAISHAVSTLSPDDQFTWQHKLMVLVNDTGPKCGPFANANAAIRAEAFLKTLNLWTE